MEIHWQHLQPFIIQFFSELAELPSGLTAAPPIRHIWPSNSISHIQYYLFIDSQDPPINTQTKAQKGQDLLLANHLDQSMYLVNQEEVLDCAMAFVKSSGPINISGHSRIGVRLCSGFCQP